MEEDRYTQEALRLAELVRGRASSAKRSIRSLEIQSGVGTSIFHKVLKGEVTMQLRHLLMMLDGLGLEWGEFFRKAYPLPQADLDEEQEKQMEKVFLKLLRRYGLLPPDSQPPAPEPPQG